MCEYNPKVSIVIPVYNGSNYLREAIESALAQTYKNIEIIVVNDGSNDNGETEKIATSYGNKIKYFTKINGGSSSAINLGIKNMTGDWFSWLSHDDLYYPNKIEKQIEYIKKNGNNENDVWRNIYFAASECIDSRGKLIRRMSERKRKKLELQVSNIKNNTYLVAEPIKYCFYGCTCLIHRKVFEISGGFNEQYRWANDLELWIRLYCQGYRLHYLSDVLASQRLHSKQVSKQISFSYHNKEQDSIWNSILEWLKANSESNYEVFHLFGKSAFLKTRNVEGEAAFEIAKKIQPSNSMQLLIEKILLKLYASIFQVLKKIYILIKI